MKILNINNYHFVRGGSDQHYFDLGTLLQKRGNQVVWFAGGRGSFRQEPGVYLTRQINTQKPSLRDVFEFLFSRPARKIAEEIIEKERPEIAHLHIYYSQLTSSILKPLKKAGIPIVQTLHEYKLICTVATLISNGKICEACEGKHFWKAAVKRCNRRSFPRSVLNAAEAYISNQNGAVALIDQFIAPSEFLKRKLVQYGLNGQKITVLPNFIKVDDYQPSVCPGKHVVYLGRLEKIKGIFEYMELAARFPEIPFLLVGSGDAEKDAQRYVNEKRLKNVRLLGFKNKDEIREILRESFCVVVPSLWYENCPIVILEAMAMGRPVIGSDLGGIPELIVHGKDGFLVKPGDVGELASALSKICATPETAITMGKAGREKVEEKYSEVTFYTRLINIYQNVLSQKA